MLCCRRRLDHKHDLSATNGPKQAPTKNQSPSPVYGANDPDGSSHLDPQTFREVIECGCHVGVF